MIVKLTRSLVLYAFKHVFGLTCVKDALVLPLATGMSLTMSMLALKQNLRPEGKYVLFSRID